MEKTAKRIGFEEALHLMYRRGGYSVLVKRTAKYEVPGKDGPTVLGVEAPKTLFPRGILHSSVVAHILVQKLALGVPHYRLEQHLEDQGVELGRGTMCRYVEEAGNALGATVAHAMWQDALANAAVISTDATPSTRRRRLPAGVRGSRTLLSGRAALIGSAPTRATRGSLAKEGDGAPSRLGERLVHAAAAAALPRDAR